MVLDHPQYLAIGHTTIDLLPEGKSSPGGTVLYAMLTAERLGVPTALLTSSIELAAEIGHVRHVANIPTAHTTTLRHTYVQGKREQTVCAVASFLTPAHIPRAWIDVPIVHIGPVLDECDPALIQHFPHALVGVTPQGWMRRWDTQLPAPMQAKPWQPEPALLERIGVLILSIEDIHGDHSIAAEYARSCPCVVVTEGKAGALLYVDGIPQHIPAYPANEVDSNGAGDVYTAAMLISLHETGDPVRAAHFAARVAAISVEGFASSNIPTRAQVTDARS